MRREFVWAGLACVAGVVCGCSSSSDDSAQPLSVPSQMSIVAAQDTAAGSVRLIPGRYRGQSNVKQNAKTGGVFNREPLSACCR